MNKNILIVEDDETQRFMVETIIGRKLNMACYSADNGCAALEILKNDSHRSDIKLVIMDLQMPVMGGIEALQIMQQQYPALPVIMLSGSTDTEDVVQAMKLGATDFVNKPFETERLKVTIENALKMKALSNEVVRLKNERNGEFKFENLIGSESGLLKTISIARKAALSDIQVLITGETGTGKEVFAKAIHGESSRKGKPFVAINCGAIPAQLIESILFGHEKGAFTGAVSKSLGKFREADGGTIFLDEIGDLPAEAQVKLLRVIQQKEVEPVGAGKTVSVDVRIISATHHNLEDAVAAGKFREDLYFRLNVFEIELPPLRERREDIPLLVRHFIDRFCVNENIALKTISAETDKMLMEQEWAGNVRELENTIHRAIIMNETGLLEPEDFKNVAAVKTFSFETRDLNIFVFKDKNVFKTTEEIEQELIHMVLHYFDGNITKASAAIGMAKSTFYKKMNIKKFS